jgi:hypothetical protein
LAASLGTVNSMVGRLDLRWTGIAALMSFGLVAGAMPLAVHAQQAGGAGQPPTQTAALPDAAAPVQPENAVPRSVLAGLLSNSEQSAALIRNFLAGEGGDPSAISRRSLDLVTALQQSGLVTDPSLISAITQRVATAASDTLNSMPVLELKVDKTFTAPPGVKAFDFGPPDKAPQNGFQRVLPNDPMLQGQTRGLRRPGDEEGILSGGIAGVKNISVKPIPDGEYRVTLMTEALGDANLTLAPFGNVISANGQNERVLSAPPDHWANMMVMSAAGLAGAGEAENSNGGGLTLIVKVVGGQLNLGFNFDGVNQQALQTYLTGMVIEPVNQPSIFARTPDAPPLQPNTENRLRQEASLLAALVNAATTPAAGPPVPVVDDRPDASPS